MGAGKASVDRSVKKGETVKRLTDKEAIQRRIHKVVGQCNGVENMLRRGDSCEAILLQVSAAMSALHRVGQLTLEYRLRDGIRKGFKKGEAEKKIGDNLSRALDDFCSQA